ncbi:peptide deformylase, mitochondrial-like [Wyeomyia smithii]|uniref:peptide deformylase, mitochondrial-like n=1 Tax=Wyeomyia smithii TaxID=174621 RepID=UPI002467E965|nr:peptide deformylase, mitochondrial-like [Wyeomyia smithii]XP_055532568.1 peptide deformylase, mitochondrial-like [Wyeomyia smithii]XP_055532569.1 peptide deformylase, mitochondrial-like [Wyeomyia smithii]XP_055534661.1 peptide deformylase, mitochondrial-like [Wyeomyia smithii]XP_055534662.1 peptide deformylase, mitochondrial-like [Wyeomyia smithii]XP_055534663.1 peptide deformylase, mitochondrial-like [Wyeomyia smithii]
MFLVQVTRRNISNSVPVASSFGRWYRDFWQPAPANEPPYDHVTQIGDPVLRKKADPVPPEMAKSPEVQYLIKSMVNVMRKFSCVGLAAPQIGISLRILVMEFKEKLKDEYTSAEYKIKEMETLPLTVFINPELKVLNYEKKTFPEACQSVRGYSGEVARYSEVLLRGVDENGSEKELALKGWNARIAQHEMDHLDGIVYTDLMKRNTFTCTCWQAVNEKRGRVSIFFHKKMIN